MDKKSYRWRGFEEAREYVRGVGLRNLLEWMEWASSSERPEDIPSSPMTAYKGKGWLVVFWLAIVNTAVAFTLWNHTLRTLSAMESSVINNTMIIWVP